MVLAGAHSANAYYGAQRALSLNALRCELSASEIVCTSEETADVCYFINLEPNN